MKIVIIKEKKFISSERLMIILKVTKKQGFTLKNTYLEKSQGESI